ncbi:SpdD-like protein [Streptomyces sp. NPDC050738]|uniref:SpdD-like protein n=1 Tax=Streptomyces sp. NPDC050738 TaxID=3154744 RepID=UPI003448141E
MFKPQYPTNPTPTGAVYPVIQPTAVIPAAPVQPQYSAPCACQNHNPAPAPAAPARTGVQLSTGGVIALAVGGTGVVLVVGAVLVSMFLAVAVTAGSLALLAVVLRSMLNNPPTNHR